MCAKGKSKKARGSAEKNHGSETLFPEEEVERMEREDDIMSSHYAERW